jgi:hypothetical protein
MLRQYSEEERRRRWWSYISEEGSLGMGLLRLIPHPPVRWAILAGCILLPILLVRYGGRSAKLAGMLLGLFVFVLFAPKWFWRDRDRHWWWT